MAGPYFWDPVAGNDGADGLSFANRKKTLQSFTGVAAGETVRCIASPDATSLGQNATWTDGSNTITLTTAVTTMINSCEATGTASTNVTATTTATGRKVGTVCTQIAVASAFTTGKAWYFATGSLDLSNRQQVTFWFRQTLGTLTVANDYEFRLCTDTIGATGVHTIPIPAIPVLNQWFPLTVDLGTNLNAAIQSIAFYVNVDRAAVTFQVDEQSACKASASADSLTLTSLIGKNNATDPFLAIRSINGTTVTLDSAPMYTLDVAGTEPLYSGITETVTAWKRETLKTPMQATQTAQPNYYAGTVAGTSGSPINVSGGWNTTDMSTQTGNTYLDGQNGYGYGISLNASQSTWSYLKFSKINCCRYDKGYYLYPGSSTTGMSIICDDVNNNSTNGVNLSTFGSNYTVTITNICKNGISTNQAQDGLKNDIGYNYGNRTITITNLNSNWGNGYNISNHDSGVNLNVINCCRNRLTGITIACVNSTINVTNLNYNIASTTTAQLMLSCWAPSYNSHDNVITLGSSATTGNTCNGIWLDPGTNNNKIIITGAFSGYSGGGYNNACIYSCNTIKNFILSTGTPFTGNTQTITQMGGGQTLIKTADLTIVGTGQQTADGVIVFQNYNGIPGNHKIWSANQVMTRFGI